MFIFALALAAAQTGAPTALTKGHQSDIACVVEIAVLANAQKRGITAGADVQANGRRWAGIVGDRIMFETGQPRELIAVAMTEAAKARAAQTINGDSVAGCLKKMNTELAMADAADVPLPKPMKP